MNLKDPKRGHLPYYAAPVEVSSFSASRSWKTATCAACSAPIAAAIARSTSRTRSCSCRRRRADAARHPVRARLRRRRARQVRARALLRRAGAPQPRAHRRRGLRRRPSKRRARSATSTSPPSRSSTRAPSATRWSAPSARRPRAWPACRSATTPASPRWWSRTSTSCPPAARSATRTRWSSPRRCGSTGMESLLVLPLISRDEAIGSFAVAAKRARAFGKDKREMLAVIANHVAVSLPNAQHVRPHGRDGHHRRPDRPGQPPHLPGALLRDAGARRAHRRHGTRCSSPTSITSRRSTTPTATRSATSCCAASPPSCATACARSIWRRATAAKSSPSSSRAPISPARASSPSASAPRCRSRSSSRRRARSAARSRSASPSIPTTAKTARRIIDHADQSLYSAKHGGRNRAVAWHDLNSVKLKAVK